LELNIEKTGEYFECLAGNCNAVLLCCSVKKSKSRKSKCRKGEEDPPSPRLWRTKEVMELAYL